MAVPLFEVRLALDRPARRGTTLTAPQEGSMLDMHSVQETPLLTALQQVEPPGHLCSIYESPEEQFAVAIPFIQIGLERGEKCIYVADDDREGDIREAMHGAGIDFEQAVATDRLVLARKEDAYLKRGSFDPDWMITFWMDAAAEAKHQGFTAIRVTGETAWVIRGAPGLDRWVDYESQFTRAMSGHRCVALCQYNRELFPPEVILDVIRTHPTVIYRGVVCSNLYHVPPDELIGPNQAAREVDRLLSSIRERAEVEHTLRRQRNELRKQLEDTQLAEAALRASEERWRSVFENSAIGIGVADPEGRILATNQAFQELVGYTGAELSRLTVMDVTHDDDVPRNIELRAELVAGVRSEMQMEKRYRRKDGRLIWVRVTSSLIPGTDRTPVAVMAIVEDITAQRRAEQERDALLGQSRALAGRLMHAQDDEGRRIARMLHETTAQDLAGLKMLLARLNRTASHLSESERSALTESISLADRSMTEIRTLSYLLHPPFLDENGLLSALRWYAAGYAERSGIAVDLELPASFERLPLDTETALFRIVQESLNNLHRHSGSETARIVLQRDAGQLVLEIQDRGHGFEGASLAQVRDGGGGAGVGIAGMSERIEQLGGRLEITSSDRGTTVRVRLPLVQNATG